MTKLPAPLGSARQGPGNIRGGMLVLHCYRHVPNATLDRLQIIVVRALIHLQISKDDPSCFLYRRKVTLDHAIAAATSTIYPGSKLLEAEVDTNNGVPTYVIDVKKDGKHTVLVNIRTGEVKIRHGDEDEGDDSD